MVVFLRGKHNYLFRSNHRLWRSFSQYLPNSNAAKHNHENEPSIQIDKDNEPLPNYIKTSLGKATIRTSYSTEETDRIEEYHSAQQPYDSLVCDLISQGFQEYVNNIKKTNPEVISSDSLEAVRKLQEQYKNSQQVSYADSLPSWTPYRKDDEQTQTTYLQDFRSTKTSDFLWSLQKKMLALNDTDGLVQSRFNYLNNCMSVINDQNHVLFCIDTKVLNDELREIGITIYDPEHNQNSIIPTLERYHIILRDFHGVLSTNSYHGDSVKLTIHKAIDFIRTLTNRYFILETDYRRRAKLVGHSTLNSIKVLGKHGIVLPTNKNDIFDTHLLYMIPFLYQQQHYPLKAGTSNIKLSAFMDLEQILKRLKIPFADIHNVGNRSYLTMFLLLTLTNPYTRIRFELDDINANLKYMEGFLVTELEDILRSWNTKSHVSVESYTKTKKYPSISHKRYQDALLNIYK